MRLFLTNDDGGRAPGLLAFERVILGAHPQTVVAVPAMECSNYGTSLRRDPARAADQAGPITGDQPRRHNVAQRAAGFVTITALAGLAGGTARAGPVARWLAAHVSGAGGGPDSPRHGSVPAWIEGIARHRWRPAL